MSRIEAVIFDVGQVLHAYDPKPIHQDIIDTLEITKVVLRKPDPEIYELVLNKLQISANKGLFIDDRDDNIEAAKNLGIYGHLFVNAELLKTDLQERFEIHV